MFACEFQYGSGNIITEIQRVHRLCIKTFQCCRTGPLDCLCCIHDNHGVTSVHGCRWVGNTERLSINCCRCQIIRAVKLARCSALFIRNRTQSDPCHIFFILLVNQLARIAFIHFHTAGSRSGNAYAAGVGRIVNRAAILPGLAAGNHVIRKCNRIAGGYNRLHISGVHGIQPRIGQITCSNCCTGTQSPACRRIAYVHRRSVPVRKVHVVNGSAHSLIPDFICRCPYYGTAQGGVQGNRIIQFIIKRLGMVAVRPCCQILCSRQQFHCGVGRRRFRIGELQPGRINIVVGHRRVT